MERRKVLIGLGSLAAGGAAAMGSGAFTSVEADRDIEVEVAGDADAFLGVEPADTPNGDAYATETDGTVELNFDDGADFSEIDGTDGGSGINDRALTDIQDVITVTNQGTQEVTINVDFQDADGNPVGDQASVGVAGPVLRIQERNPDDDVKLEPGESQNIGVFFNLGKDEDFEDVIEDLETIVIFADTDPDYE